MKKVLIKTIETWYIGFLFGVISFIPLGHWVVTEHCRNEAIKHKAAFYVVDEKTGKTSFIWNNEVTKEK